MAKSRALFIRSSRSFFFVTPPMCCLDIVRMIVSPRTAHAFGVFFVIRNNIVVIREFEMTDRAYATLLPNLPVQQLPHVCRLSDYAEWTVPPF